MLFRQKHIDDQQPGADADRRVGDVECRVMPAAELDVDKIDHEPEPQAVGDVAGDTGEQQGERAEMRSSVRGVRQKK